MDEEKGKNERKGGGGRTIMRKKKKSDHDRGRERTNVIGRQKVQSWARKKKEKNMKFERLKEQ